MGIEITSRLGDGGVVMSIGERRVFVPGTIAATINEGRWLVSFTITANPTSGAFDISEVTLKQKPDGPDVMAAIDSRIKLGEAKRLAIDAAAVPVTVTELPDGGMQLHFGSELDPLRHGSASTEATRRRKRVSDAELKKFADAYLTAKSQPGNTLTAVAEIMNVGRATAGRRVDLARVRGILNEGDDQ
ncbi:MAG: hypothetical protein JWN99_3016 [Ilumatobacteraceae bacterium]|nr:hypothetical protein [Ilumatobacteraceae bacterium]